MTNTNRPDLSVVVCTYNRCESLKDTLKALAAQQTDTGTLWELLVIDNNSKDQTKAVCEAAARSFPVPLRYVFEGKQGLSAARNRALQEVRGTWMLFTDDDVLPHPDWVRVMLRAFKETEADCLSGKILPLWETAPPAWLDDNRMLYGDLAMLDNGDQPKVM